MTQGDPKEVKGNCSLGSQLSRSTYPMDKEGQNLLYYIKGFANYGKSV